MMIISVSWTENQHIRLISEGSCDAEDWSKGINYILKYIQIEISYFEW